MDNDNNIIAPHLYARRDGRVLTLEQQVFETPPGAIMVCARRD